jgi:hypothetical protein
VRLQLGNERLRDVTMMRAYNFLLALLPPSPQNCTGCGEENKESHQEQKKEPQIQPYHTWTYYK